MNKNLIAQLVRASWRRRYLLVIPLLILLPLSLIVAAMTPRLYQSSALIMLPESSGLGATQAGYGFSQEMTAKVKGLDALLRSDYVLGDVLARGLPGEGTQRALLDRIEDLRKRIGVRQVSDTLVQITLNDSEQAGLGNKLNAVLAALFEGLLSPTNSASDAVSFLARYRQSEVEAIERRIREVEAKAPNLTEAMVRDNESTSKAAEDRIAAKQRHLESERAKLQRAVEAIIGADAARPKDQKAASIDAIVAKQLTERRAALAALAQKGESDTPAAKSLAETVARLTALTGQQTELIEVADEIRAERARVDQAKAMAINLASLMQQRRQLYEEIDQARARHARLMDRLRAPGGAAALSILRTPAQVQIIDAPVDPQRPLNSKMRTLLVGIAASLAFALSLATLAEQLDTRIRSPEQLVALTGLTVIASLDRWPSDKSSTTDRTETRPPGTVRAQIVKTDAGSAAAAPAVKQIRS